MNIFDARDNVNVRAFLKAIRLGEGTSDERGYSRIVGGRIFNNYSEHPNIKVWIPRYRVWSTAAGAYQIIYPTWQGLIKQYKFSDFTPDTQDLACIALILGRGALDDVLNGNFFEAIQKCSAEWASLPGSLSGQRVEDLNAIKAVYLENNGKILED